MLHTHYLSIDTEPSRRVSRVTTHEYNRVTVSYGTESERLQSMRIDETRTASHGWTTRALSFEEDTGTVGKHTAAPTASEEAMQRMHRAAL